MKYIVMVTVATAAWFELAAPALAQSSQTRGVVIALPCNARQGCDGWGKPLGPEAAARRARENAAAAERERAAVAEREAKQRQIDQEIERLGAHRAAEARRLVEMREAAERARAKPVRRGACNLPYGSEQEIRARSSTVCPA